MIVIVSNKRCLLIVCSCNFLGKKAWVTLATNDTYSLGALVLAHSLKKVNTEHEFVVLITCGVTYAMR